MRFNKDWMSKLKSVEQYLCCFMFYLFSLLKWYVQLYASMWVHFFLVKGSIPFIRFSKRFVMKKKKIPSLLRQWSPDLDLPWSRAQGGVCLQLFPSKFQFSCSFSGLVKISGLLCKAALQPRSKPLGVSQGPPVTRFSSVVLGSLAQDWCFGWIFNCPA